MTSMRRRSASRSTPIGLAVRIVLALVAAGCGYFATTQSLAIAFKERPAAAYALAPSNGQITGRYALSLIDATPSPAELAQVTRLAQRAVAEDATSVRGAAALGLVAQIKGDTPAARRSFAYAQKLSRREFQVQLWAIEDAVARNDIPGALHQYDLALRTSRTAPDVLYPVLAGAIEDAAIRQAMVRTLANRPIWAPAFTLYASANSPERAVLALFTGLNATGIEVTEEPRARLINRLLSANMTAEAWNFYVQGRPGLRRTVSRDPRFKAQLQIPTLFDWSPVESAGVSAVIQPGEEGGIVDFSAPASVGGVALQQVQVLPAGVYRISGRSMNIDQPDSSRPYWSLSCTDGREIGRVVLPNSAYGRGAFTGTFRVPSGCPAQRLALVLKPSDSISGTSGQIHSAQLVPVE